MKYANLVAVLLLTAVVLAACGGAEEAAPAAAPGNAQSGAYTSVNFDSSYENAMSAQNQLMLGTLKLDETDAPIDAEQAAALLPLWQGLRSTLNSSTSAQAEINALLKQIESKMTPDQLAAIRDMRLVQSDLAEWMQEQGIGFVGGQPGEGFPGGGQGPGGGLISPELRATLQAGGEIPPEIQATLEARGGGFSPEAQATFQAQGGFGGNRGGRGNVVFIDAIIEMLTTRAEG